MMFNVKLGLAGSLPWKGREHKVLSFPTGPSVQSALDYAHSFSKIVQKGIGPKSPYPSVSKQTRLCTFNTSFLKLSRREEPSNPLVHKALSNLDYAYI